MITGEVKNKIDRIWETFWTGGITNPLDVIEQFTYLLFIKQLDDVETTKENEANFYGVQYEPMFPGDCQKYRWSKFKNLGSADEMYDVVMNGVFPFIKNLHQDGDSAYSKYMGDAIFKIPTAAMLTKIVDGKNSLHAKAIVETFNKLYPEFGGDFIKQIDYSINYVDTLIDDFSTKEKMPQIAVSVDMLDTGIDIPEILNLVFFKKVKSYSKFWQMIGRGTRLCPDLLGEGVDKTHFLIFDFCNNFEFFRANTNGTESGIVETLSEKIYNTKAQICRELQSPNLSNDQKYIDYREELVDNLHDLVVELNDESFIVKRHMRYVQTYRDLLKWQMLETSEIAEIKEHIAPIVKPDSSDELARRFDHLMYSIQLGILQSKNVQRPINTVITTAIQLSGKMSIPQVAAQKSVIDKVQTQDFWDDATIMDLDEVRSALRSLLQYLDKTKKHIYYTDFEDTIIDMEEGVPLHVSDQFESYRKKVEHYLKSNENTLSVYKLRNNKTLNETDMKELERILWTELGSKEDYEKECGETPIGRFVRKIVGVDRAAANEAFSKFLSDEKLNLNQIRFVKLIVDYIVANGNIEDNSVFMKEPFKSVGSMPVLFKDNMSTAREILSIVETIKENSEKVAL